MEKVTAAIIIKDGRVLLARRAPGEKHAGGWEFPGGKIEPGETPEECLIRELKEELCVQSRVNGFFYESMYYYQQGQVDLLAYIVELLSGEPQLLVHDNIDWVNKHQLLKYNLLPADIPIAKKVVEDLL